MKVLIISTDRALLGERVSTGDALKRHKDYGSLIDKIDIVVFSKQGYETKKIGSNVTCYATNSKSRLFYVRDAFGAAEKLLEDNEYDLAVCQDPFLTGLVGLKVKKKYGTKLLVHFHGDFWKNKYWLGENYLRLGLLFISKRVVPQADGIRVVSGGIKDKLIKAGVDEDKVRVISTPVDLENFKQADNQMIDSICSEFRGKKLVVWVGKMRKEKNLEFLLKSFKKISKVCGEAVLIMVGQGKDFSALNKLRVELGLKDKVKMIGHVEYSRLPGYFHASSLVVLPSRHESLGKVLLEAAAAGKPVVATKTTGAADIVVEGKTGYLVEIDDQDKFVKQVLKILENNELALKMGRQAYEKISKRFDYMQSINQVVGLWNEIESGFKGNDI